MVALSRLKSIFFFSIIFLGSFLVLQSASAETYYVSQTATPGYALGDDGANGTSTSTPFLTLGKANNVAASGDEIIINDGTYLTTDGAFGANYLLVAKPLTFTAVNYGSVTIHSTHATMVIWIIPGATGTGTYTFNGLVVDGESRAARTFSIEDSTKLPTVVLNHVSMLNPTNRGIHFSEPIANLTIHDSSCTMGAATTASAVCVSANRGTVAIDGFVINMDTNVAGFISGIEIQCAAGASCSASVSNVTGSIANSNAGAGVVNGIRIHNVTDARILDNELSLTVTSASLAMVWGLKIASDGGVQCDGGKILRNVLNTNFRAGYGISIGVGGGDPEEYNTSNNGEIAYNTIIGTAQQNGDVPHGIMVGRETGTIVHNNYVEKMSPAVVLQADGDSVVSYNVFVDILPSNIMSMYCKGCSGGAFKNNTMVQRTGYVGFPFQVSTYTVEGPILSTAADYYNNIALNQSGVNPGAAKVSELNVGTFDYNLYYSNTAWASNAWSYQGVDYDNFAAWQTAGYDSNSKNSDPAFVSTSDYQLQSTSSAIDAGTDVSLTADYLDHPIYGTPDIGAYEYQPPYTQGTNLVSTSSPIRIYADGQFRYTTVTSTADAANFTVTPSVGTYYTADYRQYLDVTLSSWLTAGTKNKEWIATSTIATTTLYTIGDLSASTYYTFKLDGAASTTAISGYGSTTCTNGICLADANGQIQFIYSGGYSTHTFALEQDTSAPANVGISSVSADSTSQLTVTASVATDADPGLHSTPYYFNETTGHDGGSSSDWQAETTFIDSGLSLNTQYTYQVKAKDGNTNTSAYSDSVSKYTLAAIPTTPTLSAGNDATQQITATWTANNNPAGTEYYVEDAITTSRNSGWITATTHTFTALTAGTAYSFRVKARNGDSVSTNYTSSVSATTQSSGGSAPAAAPPTIPPTVAVEQIKVGEQSFAVVNTEATTNIVESIQAQLLSADPITAPSVSATFGVNSGISMNIGLGNDSVILASLTSNSATFILYSTPQKVTIKTNEEVTKDMDNDGKPDLYMKLTKVDEKKKQATITITDLNDLPLTINDNLSYTTSPEVTLTVKDIPGVTQIAVSEDKNFAYSSFEPYTKTRSFTLSPKEGLKTIYLRFRNAQGGTADVKASITYTKDASAYKKPTPIQKSTIATNLILRNLCTGSPNKEVRNLQTILINLGYLKIDKPTGYYVSKTKAAVRQFQLDHKLSPAHGCVGPATRGVLNEVEKSRLGY